jgi:hypothetical protein
MACLGRGLVHTRIGRAVGRQTRVRWLSKSSQYELEGPCCRAVWTELTLMTLDVCSGKTTSDKRAAESACNEMRGAHGRFRFHGRLMCVSHSVALAPFAC